MSALQRYNASTPLTPTELANFNSLEAEARPLARSAFRFYEILKEIRDCRYYRESYPSFGS
jgi:hypothetical protein